MNTVVNTIYDMHCHLDFADNCEEIAAHSKTKGIAALSSTVQPSSFVCDRKKFAPYEHIQVSLGIHPWWIANGRVDEADIAQFEHLVPETRFIGEVGLDFHSTYKNTKTHQQEVFNRLLHRVRDAGDNRLIILHAVRATTAVLDELNRCGILKANTCVFHWFTGSYEELKRAVSAGCFFSVGMRMMSHPKTKAFAAAIPEEQLLLETDSPPHEGMVWSVDAWREELEITVKTLAEIRHDDGNHILDTTSKNAHMLLGQ